MAMHPSYLVVLLHLHDSFILYQVSGTLTMPFTGMPSMKFKGRVLSAISATFGSNFEPLF